jgi:Na+/H+-dicarboxylate symporter
VIFLTIVTGIAGMTHLRTVGRVFGKAMAYFLFFSTLALVVGLVVANVVQPGAGMNVNVAKTSTGPRSMATSASRMSSRWSASCWT